MKIDNKITVVTCFISSLSRMTRVTLTTFRAQSLYYYRLDSDC